jgi:hypothetical protein
MRLLAAAALLVVTGCAAAPSFDLTLTRIAPGATAYEANSGFTSPANLVVRDQAALEALWATVHANVTPRPPAPIVDFGRYLIVARAMGPRPTGGYDVVISNLIRQGQEFVVQVRETQPGAGCGVTQAVTSPVDVARIMRTDDAIKFAIATDIRNCSQ